MSKPFRPAMISAWGLGDESEIGSMATKSVTDDQLVQMRLAHLSMIQGVIGRMSGYSASVKTFCVTIVSGAVALKAGDYIADLTWPIVALVCIFAALDSYYLTLERDFRAFYNTVAQRSLAEAGNLEIRRSSLTLAGMFRAALSPSVSMIYVPLAIAAAFIVNLADPNDKHSPPISRASGPVASTVERPHSQARVDLAESASQPKLSSRNNRSGTVAPASDNERSG